MFCSVSDRSEIADSFRLPNIEDKIQAQAALVDEQLQFLPELPNHNVQHVVRQCLQDFSNLVKGFLQGGANANDFLCNWGQLTVDFGSTIQAMKPKFAMTDPSLRVNRP